MFPDKYNRRIVPSCLWAFLLSIQLLQAADTTAKGPEELRLALSKAMELALSRNLGLAAKNLDAEAAAARERQADLIPNPEIEAEVEDIGITSGERGFDSSVYTVRGGQRIEMGGKRGKRSQAASLTTQLAEWDLLSARLDLKAEVKTRFFDLLAAQERLRLATASYKLSHKIRGMVAERVKSGKVSSLELTRAEVELAGQRIGMLRTEQTLAAAKTTLAALWNATPEEASRLKAKGNIREISRLSEVEAHEQDLDMNPDLTRWETEGKLAEAKVSLEKAKAVPDVTVSAAIAHERGSGNQVVEFAVGVPLPIFNRNRGNIRAALAELHKAQKTKQAVHADLRAQLAEKKALLRMAAQENNAIRNEMLPGAAKVLAAAQEAYRSGKIAYLDVLDAQQTLFETEMQWVEAFVKLHRATTAVERIIGEVSHE